MNLTQGRKLAIRNFINPVMTIFVVSFEQVIRASYNYKTIEVLFS